MQTERHVLKILRHTHVAPFLDQIRDSRTTGSYNVLSSGFGSFHILIQMLLTGRVNNETQVRQRHPGDPGGCL